MTVITRFAPSPTGYLHIGSARTALFNYLFSRHMGGKFLLRIEDTDRARSTDLAITAIIEGMQWLGLEWDGEVVYQFTRSTRHAEIAKAMVETGHAYYCYTSPEDLTIARADARSQGKIYYSKWRDSQEAAPADVKPVIRLRANIEGETVINDQVQGRVVFPNSQLDDMVLLRWDGTPTYMLAVVVDDHDMGITHIIRGDDHLNNAARQAQIYQAMNWQIPNFAHIPLIHGPDGAKLSKRHGALGIDEYRKMGYLADSLANYLLRLGWSHGNDELISRAQAINWFNLESIGRSAARIDFKKMDNINSHYLKQMEDLDLVAEITPVIEEIRKCQLRPVSLKNLRLGMAGLKTRAKTILELASSAAFYVVDTKLLWTEKASTIWAETSPNLKADLISKLAELPSLEDQYVQQLLSDVSQQHEIKIGEVATVLRVALTGSTISPSVNELMLVLGKEECLLRLKQPWELSGHQIYA